MKRLSRSKTEKLETINFIFNFGGGGGGVGGWGPRLIKRKNDILKKGDFLGGKGLE